MKRQQGMTIAWVTLVIIVVLGALGIGYYYYQVNQQGQEETEALQEEILEQKAENVDLADENQTEKSGESDQTKSDWKEVTIKSLGFQITLTNNWSDYQWKMPNADMVKFTLPTLTDIEDDNQGDNRATVLYLSRYKDTEPNPGMWELLKTGNGYNYYYFIVNNDKTFQLKDGTKSTGFYKELKDEVIPSLKLI